MTSRSGKPCSAWAENSAADSGSMTSASGAASSIRRYLTPGTAARVGRSTCADCRRRFKGASVLGEPKLGPCRLAMSRLGAAVCVCGQCDVGEPLDEPRTSEDSACTCGVCGDPVPSSRDDDYCCDDCLTFAQESGGAHP